MSGSLQIQCFKLSTSIGWRLLSGNNRMMGRGTGMYTTEAACREAVVELQQRVARTAGRTRRVPDNRWTWELDLDARAVAMSGHTFDRMIRCEQSLATFCERFADAELRPVVIDLGSRRWHFTGPRRELQ